MKKFKFRLQRVLDFRHTLKREKERDLAQRNSELKSAEHRLGSIKEAQEAIFIPESGEMTMAELMLAGDYSRFLQDALVKQRLHVLEAAGAVEAARDAYIKKAVEAETLEKLRAKREREHDEERRKDARKELDELTVQRHRFKREES